MTLFAVSFLAATILPFYSEIALVVLAVEGYDPVLLWLAATAGNTLGAVFNWALARYLLRFQDRRWFPFGADRLGRAQAWFERYGTWSLLLAWAPIGGDALTFVAGLMKTPIVRFLILVGIGKGCRYAVVLAFMERLT
ncbi:YqaA family protein [Engelhardtia mirabilis]|uniref:Inner membrane protein YqaA n=1 Tax=Engelhardtia mirabilis TaxID=2528011 RepID=A0A518BE09_9BACT|nr:Inner membrane protein YqaA [Planctomycetes bacterium Pla133]QDU99554.1 Inner membrane protein YqaA [Planctomycetes bacterium Pla86]